MMRRDAIKMLGLTAMGGALAMATESFAAGAGESEASEHDIGYKNGEFVLPPLAYDYAALEPHLDAQTMKLHHDMHHAAYVKGANAALKALKEIAADQRDAGEVKHYERELGFHGSGHALHTIFWRNMSPEPGPPSPELKAAIERDFGGMEAFKTLFSASSNAVEGSGWGILGYHPLTGGLLVVQAEKHQDLTVQGLAPLLALDVWEHAYYLKYQNRRADYVKAWWNVVDWADVSRRYAAVLKG